MADAANTTKSLSPILKQTYATTKKKEKFKLLKDKIKDK